MPEDDRRHARTCDACEQGDHFHCGLQTWCQCDCDGPYGDYTDPYEDDEGEV
jgi:hypothetical protein